MASNYLSIYGIAIATCCLSVGIAFLYENFHRLDLDIRDEKTVGIVVLGAVVPMLLLLGIVKKWSWLILPSILAVVSVAVYLAFGGFGAKAWGHGRFYDYMNIILQIAVEVTLLYPLCHLFAEMRRKNVAVKNDHIIHPTTEVIVSKALICN